MAILAASQVSFANSGPVQNSEWCDGGPSNKRNFTRQLKLTSLAQGGATNTMGATALGFQLLVACTALYDATNSKIYPAVVDLVNNRILLQNGASNAVGDVTTTTAYITVTGTPFMTAH